MITMKKLVCVLLAIGLTSTIWYGCKDKEDLPGILVGEVLGKSTGEPIKTAGVELQPVGLKTVTGTDGQYSFPELEPGTYKLYITKTGYSDYLSSEIVVKSEQTARGDVQLEKLPPALRIVNDKAKDIDELDFGAAEDDVMSAFNIFNDGTQTLQWQITKACDWIINVSKESGELGVEKMQAIIVTIDRERLKGGDNVTTMHITSDDGSKQLKIKATGESRSLPVLNALETTDITRTSAIFHGVLTDVGSPFYTERGFVYGISSMPTMENTNSKLTVAVTENNEFEAAVMGLEENKIYYVRAYAINKAGIAYSTNEDRFMAQTALPKIVTQSVTDITDSTAMLNLWVQSLGDPPVNIDEVGFVYGLIPNLVLDGIGVTKEILDGTGVGAYKKQIGDLQIDKVYYVRAYMRYGNNIVYGDVVSFKAESPLFMVVPGYALMVQKEDLGGAHWSAANTMCENSTLGGYNDWRLPTIGELMILYNNRALLGGFAYSRYWTSVYCGTGTGSYYIVDFSTGTQGWVAASTTCGVRAVRTITK